MIALVVVDDHPVVRSGLCALLAEEKCIQVVGEAENGREAIALCQQTRPDVVLMDVAMPQLNGLEATREILKALPSAKVVGLSAYNDVTCVDQMAEAGAVGFLSKQTAADDLLNAIHQVQQGNSFFSPVILKRLRERSRRAAACGQVGGSSRRLTTREDEVLRLIAQSWTNAGIGNLLGISRKTVEKHRQRLMDKLQLHSAAALTRYALSVGVAVEHEENPPTTAVRRTVGGES